MGPPDDRRPPRELPPDPPFETPPGLKRFLEAERNKKDPKTQDLGHYFAEREAESGCALLIVAGGALGWLTGWALWLA